MKPLKVITIISVAILISLPSLAFAKGKPPKDDPPQEIKVYRANLSGELIGTVWTRPNTEKTDPSNIQWNGNGGNVIAITLGDYFRGHHYGDSDAQNCFPDISYGGSLHLYDKSSSRKDTNLVARFWFNANSDVKDSGDQLQYVIDMYDDEVYGGWEPPTMTFPPEVVGDILLRDVTSWEMRTTTKNKRDVACLTGSEIHSSDPIVDFELKNVPICENPFVDPDC